MRVKCIFVSQICRLDEELDLSAATMNYSNEFLSFTCGASKKLKIYALSCIEIIVNSDLYASLMKYKLYLLW
jgi:hypothetical protein